MDSLRRNFAPAPVGDDKDEKKLAAIDCGFRPFGDTDGDWDRKTDRDTDGDIDRDTDRELELDAVFLKDKGRSGEKAFCSLPHTGELEPL